MSRETTLRDLLPLVQVAEALAQKYDVVVTNPPYMAVSNAGGKVNEYVKKRFPEAKADLFAVFMEKGLSMLNTTGLQAMITQQAFLFTPSFAKFSKRRCARHAKRQGREYPAWYRWCRTLWRCSTSGWHRYPASRGYHSQWSSFPGTTIRIP